jgi:hypothetical protein
MLSIYINNSSTALCRAIFFREYSGGPPADPKTGLPVLSIPNRRLGAALTHAADNYKSRARQGKGNGPGRIDRSLTPRQENEWQPIGRGGILIIFCLKPSPHNRCPVPGLKPPAVLSDRTMSCQCGLQLCSRRASRFRIPTGNTPAMPTLVRKRCRLCGRQNAAPRLPARPVSARLPAGADQWELIPLPAHH